MNFFVIIDFLGHLDELWGLACHPTLAQFVTAGWDRLLQMWDALSHSTVWSKDIGVSIPIVIILLLKGNY